MNHIAAPLALGSKKRSFVTGSAALESTKPGTLTAPTSPLPRKMLATPQKRIHSGTENTLQRGRVLGNIRKPTEAMPPVVAMIPGIALQEVRSRGIRLLRSLRLDMPEIRRMARRS